MSPSDEPSFASSSSKKIIYTLVTIKVLELLLIFVCLGLIDEPATHSLIRVFITPRVIALCYITFGAYVIYTSIFLIMALFGELTPWRTATLWSLFGFVLFIATTIFLFRDWSTTKDRNYWHPNMTRLDLVLSTACVSLVTTLLFLVDLLVTARLGA